MTDSLVVVDGLNKSYGSKLVLDRLSFTVRRGEVFGLLGPNGAGKTTTLEILEGLRTADSGRIELFGLRHGRGTKAILQRLGVTLQSTQYWDDLSVLELVRFFRSCYRRGPEPEELLARFELAPQARLPLRALSGGPRPRVSIAQALVQDPDLVLLVEPSSGLDPQARRLMWAKIHGLRAEGKTLILTTHYREEAAQLCDRVAILSQGRILTCDSPSRAVKALRSQLAVTFTAGGAALDPAALAGQPWCSQVKSVDGERVTVYVRDLREGLGGLMEWAEREGVSLEDLQCRGATLEDVYLHHTGAAARESVQ
jgi:ABC-2 type transport system ATP-binding protein